MGVNYVPVLWNKQKKMYDRVMLGLMILYLILFVGLQIAFYPSISIETLIIRATGTLAFLMLHVILIIGPLTRLNKKFLPLLYNRRHLGVSMFLIGLIHSIFNTVQFHTLGKSDPLASILGSNMHYTSLVNFPFQSLGLLAIVILFFMAATSHDFWLKNLSPYVWKSLHMMVYVAYGLLVFHVMLGVVQLEQSPAWIAFPAIGLLTIIGVHLTAAVIERKREIRPIDKDSDGFVEVCNEKDIAPDRAKMILVNDQNIAIFKYDDKMSAVSNICRHQNGPLGEGKIVDGCIVCPWHGYQYLPENGQSPPPFKEKVETYDVKVLNGKVFVNPTPYPEGTARPPAIIQS